MSMYNLLFGKNINTSVILAILQLKESDIERFRDCGFCDDGIFVYTRTGGGNRCDFPNEKLINSKYYIKDNDDDFDSTYATYYFDIPSEIKEDVILFKDVRENGITGKLIRWICSTLEREETEHDKNHRLWETQRSLVISSKSTFIYETNGHTVVPLNDSSLDKYLTLMEQNNGCQLAYSIMPYKVMVYENVPMWGFEKDKKDRDMCRIKIDFPDKWEIDNDLWKHWKDKFSSKYPKSIKTIDGMVNKCS